MLQPHHYPRSNLAPDPTRRLFFCPPVHIMPPLLLRRNSQPYYRHHVRQHFNAHRDEPDADRVALMLERARQDAAWVLRKVGEAVGSWGTSWWGGVSIRVQAGGRGKQCGGRGGGAGRRGAGLGCFGEPDADRVALMPQRAQHDAAWVLSKVGEARTREPLLCDTRLTNTRLFRRALAGCHTVEGAG